MEGDVDGGGQDTLESSRYTWWPSDGRCARAERTQGGREALPQALVGRDVEVA